MDAATALADLVDVQLHDAPVLVRDFSDAEVLEIAIIENIQRADLNAIEEAAGFRQLMDRFGHTQEKLADFEKRLKEERSVRLAERKAKRKEERRSKWYKEREEEEQRRKDEEAKRRESI